MRLKNTYLLLTALFLVALHLVRVPSYSLDYSWLEGTFRDKDTGEPLEGVEVTIFTKDCLGVFSETLETKTGKNGRFTFLQVVYGEFIIRGRKSGYVTYQPKYKITQIYGGRKLVEVLQIEEGEMRHLDIQMERGGQLLAKIFKKDENGISPYNDFSAKIGYRASDNLEDFFSLSGISKGGEFFADGLPASDRYTLFVSELELAGYPKFTTNFEIKKGEITTIEHIFDLTDNTGLTGMIYLDNEPISIAIVSLEAVNSYDVVETSIIGYKYSFRNIQPGPYTLRVYFRKENKKYRVLKKILIEKGILKNFDVRVKK